MKEINSASKVRFLKNFAFAFYGAGIYGQGAKVANLELYVASNDEDPEYSILGSGLDNSQKNDLNNIVNN